MDVELKNPDVTTKIILDTRFTKKDGTHPVKLRVTFDRKQKYYTIRGHSYKETQFKKIMNPDNRGENKTIRKEIEAVENRAITIINQLDEFSFDNFEKQFRQKKYRGNTIQDYFKAKIQELRNEEQFQTAVLYHATLKSLEKFDNKLTFNKITPKFLKEYEDWMLTDKEEKAANSYTTIAIYMRNLRHIINKAINEKAFKETNYPFGKGKYEISKSKKTKRALNIEEIKMLFNYAPENKKEALSVSYWLFSYLCNGINMADIANLKYKNMKGDQLKFYRQKTARTANEKTEITVHLLPQAKNIIDEIGNPYNNDDDYIFPIYTKDMLPEQKLKRLKQHTKTVNKYIKRIAGNLGLDKDLTTYWARHSYSTILKNSGVPIEFISEQLGHQSIKVTQNYLDSIKDRQRVEISKKLIDFD